MSTSDTDSDDESTDTTVGTFSGRIDSDTLKVILDALEASNIEAIFEFSEDGVAAHNVDGGSVLMTHIDVPASAFESYEARELSLGVDLNKLSNANVGDEMDLVWDTDDWRLHVDSGAGHAKLSTVDPEKVRTQDQKQKIWDGTDAEWVMPCDDLKTALQVVSSPRGSAVEVHASPDFLGLRKAGDTDDWEAAFSNAEVERRDGSSMCLQNEDYLKSVRQAIPNDTDEVRCYTATDWPLIVEYSYEGVDVTFVQAPRINSD